MDNTDNTATEQVSELEVLKQRARLMGVEFSNNIGIDTLRERINAKMEADEQGTQETPAATPEVNALTGAQVTQGKRKSVRQHLYEQEMRLVRLRITCLDEKKKDLPGEIFTVANEFLGNVRKFVPFGDATEEGYHVPYCIYRVLKGRKFLQIRTKKSRNGEITVSSNWVREFALEVLPDLTPEELKKLAVTQAASGSVG